MWNEIASVRPEERSKVAWMFLYYLCMMSAVFHVGRTVAAALFLGHIGVHYLPLTYLMTAAAIVVGSLGFAWLERRVRLDRQILVTCVAGILLFATFHLALWASGESNFVIVSLFFGVELLIALCMLQFWTFATDIFTSSEGKRIFGIIGAGGAVAEIVLGFIMHRTAETFGVANFLYVAAGLFAISFVAVLFLRNDYLTNRPAPTNSPKKEAFSFAGDFGRICRCPLAISMLTMTALMTFAYVSSDLQWKRAAHDAYAGQENAIGAYFAAYFMATGFGELAIHLVITPLALRRLGVLASVAIEPAYLLLTSVILFLMPGPGLALLPAAIVRYYAVIRYSVSGAARQLLYQPIRDDFRPRFKAINEGIVLPATACVSGLAIMMFDRQWTDRGLPLIVITLMTGVLIVMWRMRKHYVTALAEQIRRSVAKVGAPVSFTGESLDMLRKWLSSDDERVVHRSVELLESLPAVERLEMAAPLLQHRSPALRLKAIECFQAVGGVEEASLVESLVADPDPAVRGRAIRAYCALDPENALQRIPQYLDDSNIDIQAASIAGLIVHCGLDGILIAADLWKAMFSHPDSRVRRAAAEILEELKTRHFQSLVRSLLHDNDVEVARVASRAAGAMRAMELIEPLIENLSRPKTAASAVAALANYGAAAVQLLSEALQKGTLTPEVRAHVARVFARIEDPSVVDPLLELLSDAHEAVRDAAAVALEKIARNAPTTVAGHWRLASLFENEVRRYFQDVAAHKEVSARFPQTPIAAALAYRRDRTVRRSLHLLAVLQPGLDLRALLRALQGNNRRDRELAIEIIDNTTPSKFKVPVIVMLDAGSADHKLRWAKSRYQIEHHSASEWLHELTDDPNEWVRAAACHQIGAARLNSLVERVRSLLEQGAWYVRETALAALERLMPREEFLELLEAFTADDHPRLADFAHVELKRRTCIQPSSELYS